MSPAGNEEPPNRGTRKPPGRYWFAEEPFFDLKASHWVEILLTLALLTVGGSQAYIYWRQAEIMGTQTSVYKSQLAFQESVSRAWVRANVTLSGPIVFTEWANDRFINLQLSFDLKNFGQVPAINIRILTAIDRMSGSDREVRLKRLQDSICKSARETADGDPVGGQVAFPNEPITIKSGSGTGGLYRNGDPGALAIIGCIDYTFADNQHGQTGFRKILGRVENKLVVGIPFVSGDPQPDQPPIPPELLAQGFPSSPAKYAKVPVDGLYFEGADGGNYAK